MLFETMRNLHIFTKHYRDMFSIENTSVTFIVFFSFFTGQHKRTKMHYTLSQLSIGQADFYDLYLTYDTPCISM